MLDSGIPLRCLLLVVAWVLTVALGIAWAILRDAALGQAGIVALTLACTLNILNDNAKTRRCTRACLREAQAGHEPSGLSSVQ